ncbi:MAG: ester cyclase [Bacteroidota bacterium]
MVTTRKILSGTHTGDLLGAPASGKKIEIEVIDIVRLLDGRYAEHWGVNTLPAGDSATGRKIVTGVVQ